MKKLAKLVSIALVSGLISSCTSEQVPVKNDRIVANPIDLNYRFQPNDESRREAADPVLEYFKGYYYMFASKSGGYWRSEDLAKWEYIPCTTIPTMEDYAPTILVYGDTLYFTASSGNTRIYKNAHPEKDTWEEVDTKFEYPQHDRRSLKMMMKECIFIGDVRMWIRSWEWKWIPKMASELLESLKL